MAVTRSLWFLDRSHSVAPANWSRWLIPPAALSVHLAIGQAYAWSVFKPPLEKALHLSGTLSALPFQLGIVMLGLSAAFGGTLVERNGPRWAMFVSMSCFSTGFLISALGAATSQYWLVVLGYGLIGGIGRASAISRRFRRSSNGFPTGRAWRPGSRSWASVAAR